MWFGKDDMGIVCGCLYQHLPTIFPDPMSLRSLPSIQESPEGPEEGGRGHSSNVLHLASLLRKFESTYQSKRPPSL